jgi:hypothetical protein
VWGRVDLGLTNQSSSCRDTKASFYPFPPPKKCNLQEELVTTEDPQCSVVRPFMLVVDQTLGLEALGGLISQPLLDHKITNFRAMGGACMQNGRRRQRPSQNRPPLASCGASMRILTHRRLLFPSFNRTHHTHRGRHGLLRRAPGRLRGEHAAGGPAHRPGGAHGCLHEEARPF